MLYFIYLFFFCFSFSIKLQIVEIMSLQFRVYTNTLTHLISNDWFLSVPIIPVDNFIADDVSTLPLVSTDATKQIWVFVMANRRANQQRGFSLNLFRVKYDRCWTTLMSNSICIVKWFLATQQHENSNSWSSLCCDWALSENWIWFGMSICWNVDHKNGRCKRWISMFIRSIYCNSILVVVRAVRCG